MRHEMNTAILIEEIKRRPVLWNRRDAGHPNKKLHDLHWDAIAAVMGTKRESVRAKWKNLRDAYRKVLKKAQVDGNPIHWMYYDQLSFIRDQTLASRDRCRSVLYPSELDLSAVKMEAERRDREGTDEESLIAEVVDGKNAEAMEHAQDFFRPEMSSTGNSEDEQKEVPSEPVEESTRTKRKHESGGTFGDNETMRSDPDYQFLISLLPHFKEVSLSRKLPLRMKIEAIVHDAAYSQ